MWLLLLLNNAEYFSALKNNFMNLAVDTVGTTEINAHGDNVRLSTSVESSCH